MEVKGLMTVTDCVAETLVDGIIILVESVDIDCVMEIEC